MNGVFYGGVTICSGVTCNTGFMTSFTHDAFFNLYMNVVLCVCRWVRHKMDNSTINTTHDAA